MPQAEGQGAEAGEELPAELAERAGFRRLPQLEGYALLAKANKPALSEYTTKAIVRK